MDSVRTLLAEAPVTTFHEIINAAGDEPDPGDVWLFTDPAAKTYYAKEGKLARLEQDIRKYLMFFGRWGPDELKILHKILYSHSRLHYGMP